MFGKGGHDEQAPVRVRICRVCDVSAPTYEASVCFDRPL
jgi:hypothetical protein